MTTELAVIPNFTVSDLQVMAEMTARGGLIKGVNTPQAAFTLMLVCQAQGRHPGDMVMRYHIIEGMPSMKADAMLAEFQARGGKIHWIVTNKEVCEATFSHVRLHPDPVSIRVELADLMENGVAKRWDKRLEELVIKDTYLKHPASMLRARVISQGVKMIDPGACLGTYTPEEIGDIIDVTATNPPLPEPPSVPKGLTGPVDLPSTREEVNAAFAPASKIPEIKDNEKYPLKGDRLGPRGLDVRAWHRVAEEEVGTANAAAASKREELGLNPIKDPATNIFEVTRHMAKDLVKANLLEHDLIHSADGQLLPLGKVVAILATTYPRDTETRDWYRRELKRYLVVKYRGACQIAENEAYGDGHLDASDLTQEPTVGAEDQTQAVPVGADEGEGWGPGRE